MAGPHVRPSSVERFTKTVGTLTVGRSGIDEISQAPWAASYATLASLTRSNGLDASPELNVSCRKPGASHVAPPSPERTTPISLAPPLKKRPTWNVARTVPWSANVSGSSSVACWLVAFVYGSALTCVSATSACAPAALIRTPATARINIALHTRSFCIALLRSLVARRNRTAPPDRGAHHRGARRAPSV